jgi:hypothetical protein
MVTSYRPLGRDAIEWQGVTEADPARLAVDTAPGGELLRRYPLDNDRRLDRAINGLVKLRRAGDAPEPEPESVGPVESRAQESAADAEPRPSPIPIPDLGVGIRDSSLPIREPDVAGPDGEPGPQGEPGPTVVRRRGREGVPRAEPGVPAHGDETPRNEAHHAPDGGPGPGNEPGESGRIAHPSAPALACDLVRRLAAGRVAGRAGRDRPGPFASAHRGSGRDPGGRRFHAPPIGRPRPPFGRPITGGMGEGQGLEPGAPQVQDNIWPRRPEEPV